MSDCVLSLEGFGLAFNERIILSSITLDIPDTGAMVLMGPCGTGKSSLLRAICGLSQASPAHRVWGQAHYAGEPLSDSSEVPTLVSQNARLMMSSILENIVVGLPERNTLSISQQRELAKRMLGPAGLGEFSDRLDCAVTQLDLVDQRLLAILRHVASNPRLLCIDEPTAGLSDEDADRVIKFIKLEAEKRAILIVLHNQILAKKLEGYTALLAGGWIQEVQQTSAFFSHPQSKVAKSFVETGTCSLPSPNASPDQVAPEWVAEIRKPPQEAVDYKSHVLGPNGFMWLKKGCLAGTPRPGLLVDIEQDLRALKRVGVTDLISLTIRPLDIQKCNEYDIDVYQFAVPDMNPPSISQALEICQEVAMLLLKDRVLAVHCRAGLGRTGTILAAQLIYEGSSALEAVEAARGIEPRWIQSESQLVFLDEFENFLSTEKGRVQTGSSVGAGVIN
ncbi:MAG: ATP-binding cassette domain-containing protein [Gammaproteobacteria bacterium]|nr:ATP-binding cassette domain-containing protein [Gammaproteobacteria bacterium]